MDEKSVIAVVTDGQNRREKVEFQTDDPYALSKDGLVKIAPKPRKEQKLAIQEAHLVQE